MRRLPIISTLLCLPICASCTTTETIVAPRAVKVLPPAALTVPCPKPDRRPWRATRDIVGTATANEAALKVCSAQVDGIRSWSEGQK
jgi:hypothetical protein